MKPFRLDALPGAGDAPVPRRPRVLDTLFVLALVVGLAHPLRAQTVRAQTTRADTALTVPIFAIGGGYDLPGADFAQRFGPGPAAQAGFWLKTKRGWLLGFDYGFRFTGKVRESVLDSIRLRDVATSNQLIGSDGIYSDVRITGRGYTLFLTGGRVWPLHLPGAGANSGLFTTLGVGFWQHKINFEDVATTAVQLSGAYKKGYDRLTNGPALTQRVGYLYLGAKRRANFFINLEATQGFTQSRRAWDFSTERRDTRQRLDLQFGVRAGWLFSVYKKLPNEFYYN
ncbi:MAG: hypothetical protein H7330_08220 [Hymenobacteraceae bacterium]|nr:hypothetical protein [Hymenobacteraceae bacterium]